MDLFISTPDDYTIEHIEDPKHVPREGEDLFINTFSYEGELFAPQTTCRVISVRWQLGAGRASRAEFSVADVIINKPMSALQS